MNFNQHEGNIVEIETRGEKRKRKNRERQAARRADLANHARTEKTNVRIDQDRKARQAGIPLRVLNMDQAFEKAAQDHASWPTIPDPEISRDALSKFRDETSLDELREFACAICSALRPKNKFVRVPVSDIDLTLLQTPQHLTAPSFEIDFNYGHPTIDNSGLKVLLDRAGFIYFHNGFDLRICRSCKKSLE